MIADFFELLSNGIFAILSTILDFFPSMPFTADDIASYAAFDLVQTVLAWVNYFLPINVCLTIISLWATGIMVYVGLKMSIKYSERLNAK